MIHKKCKTHKKVIRKILTSTLGCGQEARYYEYVQGKNTYAMRVLSRRGLAHKVRGLHFVFVNPVKLTMQKEQHVIDELASFQKIHQ